MAQRSPLAPREEIHLAERDEYTTLYHYHTSLLAPEIARMV